MAKLDNWRAGMALAVGKDGSLAPHMVFAGKVTGHSRLEDGADIVTSVVVDVDGEHNPPQWMQTLNTRYELGEPYQDPKAN